jgi:hypothetical protein
MQPVKLKERYIVVYVLIFHGTLSSMHRGRNDGLRFKVHFKKPYDIIKWSFIH